MKALPWILAIAVAAAVGYAIGRQKTPEIRFVERVVEKPVERVRVEVVEKPVVAPPHDAFEQARADLIEGHVEGSDLVKRFLAESDDATLMQYAELFKSVPEGYTDARVIQAMLDALRGPVSHRNAALYFLLGAADPDGRVARAILDHMAAGTPLGLRRLAIMGAPEFVDRNPNQRDGVDARLYELASKDADAEVRGMAISVAAADLERLNGLRAAERDASVRRAIYDRLGELQDAASTLESAFAAETDNAARKAALFGLVKTGGVAALERVRPAAGELAIDVDEYLAILASGVRDPQRIVEAKLDREALRKP